MSSVKSIVKKSAVLVLTVLMVCGMWPMSNTSAAAAEVLPAGLDPNALVVESIDTPPQSLLEYTEADAPETVDELSLPSFLIGTINGMAGSVPVPFDGWQPDSEYTALAGEWVFTPTLADGYVAAETLTYPEVRVVINQSKQETKAPEKVLGDISTMEGDGSAEDPYLITSFSELQAFATDVNSGNDYDGEYIQLENDIQLTDVWIPIGTSTNPFKGEFNGDYHVIYDLEITGSYGMLGLFGYILDGSVKRLGIKNAGLSEAAGFYSGIIAGYLSNAIIEECFVSGTVDNNITLYAGGIAGQAENSLIKNSYSSADVFGSESVGGIVGRIEYSNMQNCYATGTIGSTISDSMVGGIVGGASDYTLQNCVALNYSVAGDVDSTGRIVGSISENGDLTDNSAWAGMLVNDSIISTGTGSTTRHGEDLSVAELITASAWPTAMKAAPWVYTVGKIPTLDEFTGGVQDTELPAHIFAPKFGGGSGSTFNPYLIETEAHLIELSTAVNSGYDYAGKYIQLENDIQLTDVWIPIGTGTNPFKGVFNGDYHVIFDLEVTGSYEAIGLFGFILGGTVKRLGIKNADLSGATGRMGGIIAGKLDFSGGLIEECFVSGISGSNSIGHVGGIVGNMPNGTIQNCYSSANVMGNDFIGGIAGFIGGTPAFVRNCYATGTVESENRTGIGGIVGAEDGGGTVQNCVALNQSVAGNYEDIGRIIGVSGSTLNGNSAWDGMLVDNSIISTGTGSTTRHGEDLSVAELITASAWPTAMKAAPWDYYEGDIPILDGFAEDKQDSALPAYILAPKFGGGHGSTSKPYLIKTEAHLIELSTLVSEGNSYDGEYFKLTADLDLSGIASWTPIGDYFNPFKGTFDGDFHVITGLTVTSTGEELNNNRGLFGRIIGGSVLNLGLVEVDLSGVINSEVGGITGNLESGGTIENCFVTGVVGGSATSANIGGIAGFVSSSTIENCYSTATVYGIDNVGGIAGGLNGSSLVQNCYATGDIIATGNNAGGIAGGTYDYTLQDCVALNQSVTGNSSTSGRIAGDHHSDDADYLADNSAWNEMLVNDSIISTGTGSTTRHGEDLSDAELKTASAWPTAMKTAPWVYTVGKIPTLDGFSEGVQDTELLAHILAPKFGGGEGSSVGNPYLIKTETHLRQLAKSVNEGTNYDGKYFRLENDLELTSDWIPIGMDNSFTGEFDGNNHIISGLKIISNTEVVGLFENIAGRGTVKRLGVVNADLSRVQSVAAGIIAGEISNDALIEECFVSGIVGNNNNYYSGGMVGIVIGGTIQNSYSYVNAIGKGYVGGIAGDLKNDGIIKNCYAIGAIEAENNAFVGGIVGGVEKGNVQNCVALNQSVTSGVDTVGRIVGAGSGVFSLTGNSAWDGMLVNGSSVSSSETGATTKHGQSQTAAKLKTANAWPSAMKNTPWTYKAGEVPILKNFPADAQKTALPVYIADPTFGGGSGTSSKPYLIKTKWQLEDLAVSVNSGNDYAGKHFRLENDLDISSYAEWIPIGSIYNPFKGIFNGNYKVIRGLQITNNFEDAGLFGSVINGTIKNLGVVDANIQSDDCEYVGIIAGSIYGDAETLVIENCFVSGNIDNLNNHLTGGIVGEIDNVIVQNCHSSINGSGNIIGGIIGNATYSTIQNCYATGTVKSLNGRVAGGIVGSIENSSMKNCAALNMNVSGNATNTGRVIGEIKENTVIQGNVAFSGMLVNGNIVTSGTGAATKQGEDRSLDQLRNAYGWSTSFRLAPWSYKEGELPVLAGFKSGVQNSKIFNDLDGFAFKTHPETQTKDVGYSVEFSASTTTPAGTITYRWLVDRGDGEGFVTIDRDMGFTGETTGSLGYDPVTPDLNGWKFRLQATHVESGAVIMSNPASLTIQYPPSAPVITRAEFIDGKLILEWAPSSDVGSFPITVYEIYISIPGGDIDEVLASDVTRFELDATASGDYEVYLRAKNVAGVSDAAHAIVTLSWADLIKEIELTKNHILIPRDGTVEIGYNTLPSNLVIADSDIDFEMHTASVRVPSSDSDINIVLSTGKLELTASTTAPLESYVLRVFPIGEPDVYAECRIDVVDSFGTEPYENRVFTSSTVTIDAYKNAAGEIRLTRKPEPGVKSAWSLAGVDSNNISFTHTKQETADILNAAYDLVPTGESGLRMIVKSAAEVDKLTSSSYKVGIEISGYPDVIPGTFTLKLNKKLPAIKVSALSYNLFYAGPYETTFDKLVFTGGNVTALRFISKGTDGKSYTGTKDTSNTNVMKWAAVASPVSATDKFLEVTDPSKTKSGTLYMMATVDGWGKEVPVTISVKTVKTKPALKLASSSVTFYADAVKNNGQIVQIVPSNKKDILRNYDIRDINIYPATNPKSYPGNALFETGRYNIADGSFTISPKAGVGTLNAGKVLLTVEFGDGTIHEMALTVKIVKGTVKLKASKSTVTLNPLVDINESVTVNILPTVASYKLNYAEIDKPILYASNGKTLVTDPALLDALQVSGVTRDGSLTITAGTDSKPIPDAAMGKTYKLQVQLPGLNVDKNGKSVNDTVMLTVKILGKTMAPSVSVAVKGSVDLTTGAAATVTTSIKNYAGGYSMADDDVKLKIMKGSSDETGNFDIERTAANTWKIKLKSGNVLTAGNYKVGISKGILADGDMDVFTQPKGADGLGNYKTLSVKATKPKVTKSPTSVKLLTCDGHDEQVVTLSLPAGTATISDIRLKDVKTNDYYELKHLGGGKVAIGFKDDVAPVLKKDFSATRTLEIYLAGNVDSNGDPKATTTTTIKITAAK